MLRDRSLDIGCQDARQPRAATFCGRNTAQRRNGRTRNFSPTRHRLWYSLSPSTRPLGPRDLSTSFASSARARTRPEVHHHLDGRSDTGLETGASGTSIDPGGGQRGVTRDHTACSRRATGRPGGWSSAAGRVPRHQVGPASTSNIGARPSRPVGFYFLSFRVHRRNGGLASLVLVPGYLSVSRSTQPHRRCRFLQPRPTAPPHPFGPER